MIIFCDFFVFLEKLFLQQIFVYLEIFVDGVRGCYYFKLMVGLTTIKFILKFKYFQNLKKMLNANLNSIP